ncbi:TetR family transcriptional regulator [Pseudonocardia acidicola]|uniref:TetR family transcriptional regulator n=1 Tax=Pseudonocardia acidicola TaxID=2724939 RepID=A0ABX1SE17_9PSEU|nr:TetR family transcriptional regulator [Pseudonocardia acidicola]NMH99819.1 TetR family transcriptional regulator [Pseudonocardia acidicola]
MTRSADAPSTARRGRSAEGRAEVRRELVNAAVDLFTGRGYDETTVDDIAAAAGVGRRTFFRYFRSKEDAVSPDHESCLERVAAVFADAHPSEPLLSVVLRAGETVFDLYFNDAEVARKRFRLTHEVPALRDREAASVDHYRRLFTRQLRVRLADVPDGELRAAVTAAAVVAAHNHALRAWLADGATAAGIEPCRAHFRRVADLLPVEAADELKDVARRLEEAVGRLEQRNAGS